MTQASAYMRKIGDALVNPIGFGAMGLSAYLGPIKDDEAQFKPTKWVVDTVNVYGDNEDLIGKWFKRTGKSSEIFLATKFGITLQCGRGDSDYVKAACAKSLERLGVDLVDPNTPNELTVGAMAELVKYRIFAERMPPAIQFKYSPLMLCIEVGILEAARDRRCLFSFGPAGQYKSPNDLAADDYRRTVSSVLKASNQIKAIVAAHNATAGQAWILAQGPEFVVIPGTKKIKENLGTLKVTLNQKEE
ncbi:NADP-dependent oxidoreductase domain-containing protein [Mucidula mucida]|nr:NADP-dependent oxidoreductase domain-containing protein [Mucidula mucida]